MGTSRVSAALQATFGGQIKHQRLLAGIGLRTFARTVGIATSGLQGIEEGKHVPSVYVAGRIAKALGTTVDALLSVGPVGQTGAHGSPAMSREFSPEAIEIGEQLLANPKTITGDDILGALRVLQAMYDRERAGREAAERRAELFEQMVGLSYWTLKVKAGEGDEGAVEIVRQMDKLTALLAAVVPEEAGDE